MADIISLRVIILIIALLGDYYTNGSYGFRVESNYNVKYKFRGNLAVRFENLISGERDFQTIAKVIFTTSVGLIAKIPNPIQTADFRHL